MEMEKDDLRTVIEYVRVRQDRRSVRNCTGMGWSSELALTSREQIKASP
jgi:hypothetical protein